MPPSQLKSPMQMVRVAGSLVTLPFGWVWPGTGQFMQLALLGGLGALAHLLLTLSLAKAEPVLLAPFEFLNIVWAIAIGAVLLDEQVSAFSLVGAGLIVGACLVITFTGEHTQPTPPAAITSPT